MAQHCRLNEKTIEFVEKYLNKGDLVYVEGQIQTRKWKNLDDKERYSTEIVIPKFAPDQRADQADYTENNDNDRGSSRAQLAWSGRSPRRRRAR